MANHPSAEKEIDNQSHVVYRIDMYREQQGSVRKFRELTQRKKLKELS